MSFRVKRNTMLHKVLDPAREAAIQEEIARGHRYVIDGGLRRVPPYYFTYLTFCKQRWIGQFSLLAAQQQRRWLAILMRHNWGSCSGQG